MESRVDFAAMPWETPMAGVRHKVVTSGKSRLRLVEYSKQMEPHWCSKGHLGYILWGRFEIEFKNGTLLFEAGDGVIIREGEEHKHRARALSDKVMAVFVESV